MAAAWGVRVESSDCNWGFTPEYTHDPITLRVRPISRFRWPCVYLHTRKPTLASRARRRAEAAPAAKPRAAVRAVAEADDDESMGS